MENIYDLIFVKPWPFWAGGILIGLLVPLLYYYKNVALGVSTGYGNFVKILFKPKNLKWIETKFKETYSWRVYFITGMILGAFIASRLSGRPIFTYEMGQLTKATDWNFLIHGLFLFIGGLLLGIGARISGGCTSGHSIHGIANLHKSSILVTIMFLLGGAITANIIRFLIFGGASL